MADSLAVEALIKLGLSDSDAKTAIATLDGMKKGMQTVKGESEKAQASLRKVAEEGRKLREVGTVMAASGIAILAPFVAAANEYTRRYAGLEKQANTYIAAQKRQADATSALGRVASTALVPAMNQVAAITEKIAAFAQAHPELVSAAVTAGAGLAAGGGALVMAGTAVSTIARAAAILKAVSAGGGAASTLGVLAKAGVLVTAFAGGLKLGEVAVNAYGKAIGDNRLEHYKLSDALKTAREIVAAVFLKFAEGIGNAYIQLGRIKDIIEGLLTLAKVKIERIMLDLADGIDKFIIGLTAILAQLGVNTGSAMPDANDRMNKRSFQRLDLQDEEKGVGARMVQSDADRQAAVKKFLGDLARGAANFAETGSLGGPIDKVVSAIGDGISKFFGGAGAGKGGAAKQAYSPEAVKAFIDFNKQLADSERSYNEERKNMQYQFQEASKKAEREYQTEVQKTDRDYMHSENKANEDFYISETRERSRYSLERMRALKDANDSLKDAAAAGDVAAFVQIQRDTRKKLQRDAQDYAIADKERVDDFVRQRKEADYQHSIQLLDLKANFDKDKRERQIAYDDQLRLLQQHHGQERQTIEREFAQRLADLNENIAGLNSIQTAYYADQQIKLSNFVDANKSKLDQLYAAGLGFNNSGGTSAPSDSGTPVYPNGFGGGYGHRAAAGLARVPYDDFPALLHKDEQVLTADQANANRAGGVHVSINATVGDVASKTFVENMVDLVTNGIVQSLAQNKGLGQST